MLIVLALKEDEFPNALNNKVSKKGGLFMRSNS